jgi:hypothetical protein
MMHIVLLLAVFATCTAFTLRRHSVFRQNKQLFCEAPKFKNFDEMLEKLEVRSKTHSCRILNFYYLILINFVRCQFW